MFGKVTFDERVNVSERYCKCVHQLCSFFPSYPLPLLDRHVSRFEMNGFYVASPYQNYNTLPMYCYLLPYCDSSFLVYNVFTEHILIMLKLTFKIKELWVHGGFTEFILLPAGTSIVLPVGYMDQPTGLLHIYL